MNYRKGYYELLAFLADLIEEMESDKNKYLLQIDQKIKESDEKIVSDITSEIFLKNIQKKRQTKHSWQE